MLRYRNISYQNKPIINGRLLVHGPGKVVMGENVQINSNITSNPIGGDTRTIFVIAKDAIIKIGNNTGISNAAIYSKKEVSIGNNVKIGGSVKIYDSDFHSIDYMKRRNQKTDITKLASVKIGNDCFIGAHSIILKGVEIGDTSIVGAGSVVTKSIPVGEIWAGNPAKFIKSID